MSAHGPSAEVCIAHGRFAPCRKDGEHRYSSNPFWVKSVSDYQTSPIEGLTWGEHSTENDAPLIDLLRVAYEAGYDHGADDEAYFARGVGPQYPPGVEPDSFEKWLRDTRPIPPERGQ